tara:strand:+ start:4030 stop:4875 length:846 start_codon:yes stop_codon:yes gene_type:complete
MNLGISSQQQNISDDIIWNEALNILNESGDDVVNLTSKMVRKTIEKKLNIDLTSKKDWLHDKIKIWIQKYIQQKEEEEEEDDDEEQDDYDVEEDDEDENSNLDDDASINSDNIKKDLDEEISKNTNISQINLESIINTNNNIISDDDLSSDEDDNEDYLQKINNNDSNILHFHQETLSNNYNEISNLTKITKDENGNIIDPLHKTIPFLTKYEYTRVLGQRSKQIEEGALPFIKLNENIIDPYIIAKKELENKKIPFIIKRPLPCSGFEYWHLEDLEILIV